MNRSITIQELRKSGKYNQELLDGLLRGDFWILSQLDMKTINDRDYMEPLLFAVKNDLNTYEVYKYCGENIQSDINIVLEILRTEPSILVGTPITQNREFILNNIKNYPELMNYMSPALRSDEKFIKQIERVRSIETNKSLELAQTMLANINLIHDREFMKSAIETDVTFLEVLGRDLKNDYEFLREQSDKNEKVIEYVVNNIINFGIEGIKAVRDSSKNFTVEDCLAVIDEMAENSTDERYAKMREKIKEKGIDDIHTVRWLTAMVAQSDDVSPELVKKILNYSILTMEKTRQDVTDDGKMQINMENMQALITPKILNRLKEKVEKQNVAIDDTLNKRIEDYTSFYTDYQTQFREYKREQLMQKKVMEEMTQDVKMSDITGTMEEMLNIIKNEKAVTETDIDEI